MRMKFRRRDLAWPRLRTTPVDTPDEPGGEPGGDGSGAGAAAAAAADAGAPVRPPVHTKNSALTSAATTAGGPRKWTIFVPLWVQMTIFIAIVTLVSLLILAIVTIVKTSHYSRLILSSKLSSSAAITASVAVDTLRSLQREVYWRVSAQSVSQVLYERQHGNKSDAGYEEMANYLRDTFDIRSRYRSINIYDVHLNQTFARLQSSPDMPLLSILPTLTRLLPLQNASAVNLTAIEEDSFITQPEPAILLEQTVGFLTSITVPIYYSAQSHYNTTENTTVANFTSTLVGYGTVVLSTANNVTDGLANNLLNSHVKVQFGLPSNNGTMRGFSFVRFDTRSDFGFFPYTAYPAMSEANELSGGQGSGFPDSGALLNTHTPDMPSASVGYSIIEIMGQRWLVCVAVPRKNVYAPIWGASNKLIGICLGIFGLVLLLIIPVGRVMTEPLYRIYDGMGLAPRGLTQKPGEVTPGTKTFRWWLPYRLGALLDQHQAKKCQSQKAAEYNEKIATPRSGSEFVDAEGARRDGHSGFNKSNEAPSLESDATASSMPVAYRGPASKRQSAAMGSAGDTSNHQANAFGIDENGPTPPINAAVHPLNGSTDTGATLLNSDIPTHSTGENGCLIVVNSQSPPQEKHFGEPLFTPKKQPWFRRIKPLQTSQMPESTMAIDLSRGYHVPSKLRVFNRAYRDELDDLVDEYNAMVDKLNNQYLYLEDQVRERTQEAQEARLLAENANKAKSQFIANITHELRTPLNGIMGMTSVTLSESNIARIRVSLKVIIESARVLMELLNELLAFSRSQIDMTPKMGDFVARDLLDSLDNMFKARAEAKSLAITFGTNPPELRDMPLVGDLQRMVQIIGHILSNAIKFSDQNGSVSVIVRFRSHVDTQISLAPYVRGTRRLPPPLSMLEIVVNDNGMGISERQLARVFEPFVQGDDAFNKRHQGTGLGMSMCKQLAEVLGGYVSVFSAEGSGACVIFRTPVRVLSPQAALLDLESPTMRWNHSELFFTSSVSPGEVRKVSLNKASAAPPPALSLVDSNYKAVGDAGPGTSGHVKRQSVVSSLIGGLTARASGQQSKSDLPYSDTNSASANSNLSLAPKRSAKSTSSVGADEGALDSNGISPSVSARLVATTSPAPFVSPVSATFGDALTSSSTQEDSPAAVRRRQFLAGTHPDLKILVADDNSLNVQIMVRMLRSCGVSQVDTASDGETVVRLVEKSIRDGVHYTVIFMDLVMPRLNGLEAAQIIRTTLGYPYPIVALTGYSDQQTQDTCRAAGIQDIIVKPILRNAVADMLARYEQYSSSQQP